jgi:hypothetical protein
MMDLLKSLAARESEITTFLAEAHKEREHLMSRLSDIDQQQAAAEKDLTRVQRAMAVLDGADEPRMNAKAAVRDNPISSDELLAQAMPTTAPYRPEV